MTTNVKIKKLEEVLDLIDAAHEVKNIQQIAISSKNDNTKLAASSKLLELKGVGNEGAKLKIDFSNSLPSFAIPPPPPAETED